MFTLLLPKTWLPMSTMYSKHAHDRSVKFQVFRTKRRGHNCSKQTLFHPSPLHCDLYLQIFLEIVQCHMRVLAILLQFNVGISRQHKVEVEVFNTSTTGQCQTAQCQLLTAGRLLKIPHAVTHNKVYSVFQKK